MKKTLSLIVLLISVNFQLLGQKSTIQDLVNLVSGDTIFNTIEQLEQMERYTADNQPEIVDYLVSTIAYKGIDTLFLQNYTQDYLPNIIAIKFGALYPDSIFVLGAHYDSYESGSTAADDNASGTSGVIEVARILSDYEFEKTIMFVLFSGEELGRLGSIAFTDSTINNKIEIESMINLDMISYVNDGDDLSVSICVNNSSVDLMNTYINSLTSYVPDLKYAVDSTSMIVSAGDHSSFWSKEIPAIMLIDEIDLFSDNFNNYIHSKNDTLGLSANSKKLAELISKSVVAILIDLLVIIE